MGVQSQKQKLINGMSKPNAKRKLAEIFLKANPSLSLNRMNKKFAEEYTITFLALAETWHRLRSHSKPLALISLAFAQTISAKNALNHKLSETIGAQRKVLAKLQAERDEAVLKFDSLSSLVKTCECEACIKAKESLERRAEPEQK